MSLAGRQMLLAGAVGLLLMMVVVKLSHRGQISFRYTLGWVGVASFGVLAALFIPVVSPIASAFGLSAAALLGLGALVFITIIAIQLSISISGLQRQIQSLAKEIAFHRRDSESSHSRT